MGGGGVPAAKVLREEGLGGTGHGICSAEGGREQLLFPPCLGRAGWVRLKAF